MAKGATNNRYKFQYAAKFICTANFPGTSQTTDAFVAGSYQTAVNIHNPFNTRISLRKKIASPLGISGYLESTLGPDGVERVTCRDIPDFNLHLVHGLEGFLVIETTESVDVVAVYTVAPNGGQVSGIEVQKVKERKL